MNCVNNVGVLLLLCCRTEYGATVVNAVRYIISGSDT